MTKRHPEGGGIYRGRTIELERYADWKTKTDLYQFAKGFSGDPHFALVDAITSREKPRHRVIDNVVESIYPPALETTLRMALVNRSMPENFSAPLPASRVRQIKETKPRRRYRKLLNNESDKAKTDTPQRISSLRAWDKAVHRLEIVVRHRTSAASLAKIWREVFLRSLLPRDIKAIARQLDPRMLRHSQYRSSTGGYVAYLTPPLQFEAFRALRASLLDDSTDGKDTRAELEEIERRIAQEEARLEKLVASSRK